MAKERYKRFSSALISWLRGSSDLVTLTGHTANDPRIYLANEGEEINQYPSCVAVIRSHVPFIADVDRAIYQSVITIDCRDTNISDLYDMAGALEDRAAQDSNGIDTNFTGTNIKTDTIQFLGNQDTDFGESSVTQERGGLRLSLELEIKWRETS